MAERRMFAKAIIDSDSFLEMPISARLLYYDLGMRGDDDGFVNSPKKIMKMIGASDDDIKILITKKFIIPFESGIVVIKHWRINNYLRNDRYKETTYLEEKAKLQIEENGAYTQHKIIGIPENEFRYTDLGDTQDRSGKDSIDKDRIEEGEKTAATPYKKIVKLFNLTCTDLPEVKKISKERERHMNARWNDNGCSLDFFEVYFIRIHASDFLNNRLKTNRDWTADFDWVMNENNMAKVLEGRYDNRKNQVKQDNNDSAQELFSEFEKAEARQSV
jgi:hypothetical protein